jgi:hypothetical protein
VPARGRDTDDRQHAGDVRLGLLQAVAAVAVLAAAVVTFQQLDTDRRLLRQQLAVAGQEQAIERFASALDQLGSEQLDVRLGGIYGLERIAARGSGWRPRRGLPPAGHRRPGLAGLVAVPGPGQVFEVLSAYVRRPRGVPRSARPPGRPWPPASPTCRRPSPCWPAGRCWPATPAST